jgi:hypothetical protein
MLLMDLYYLLENHADITADFVEMFFKIRVALSGIVNQLSIQIDFTSGWLLKMIDAAKKSGFAGVTRPDDDEHLAGIDLKVDSVEDIKVTITFMEITNLHYRVC